VLNPKAKLAERGPTGEAAAAVSYNHTPIKGVARPIFVVDDDASVRDSLSVLLETLGFEVCSHSSGSQLLADDRRHDAGCLIVDQHMPGMDGIELLAALRGECVSAPMILITGRLDPVVTARASLIGVTAILEKPFPSTRLIELVRSSLGRSK
jgi:two-component system, LuxR family, response regulator FixJ